MVKGKREPKKISRRDFLKDAGFIVGGAALGVGGTVLLWPKKDDDKKAVELEIPKTKVYVSQVSLSESACTGCGTCELVCALVHEGSTGPSLRRIWLDRDPINLVHRVITCQQCDYPSCYYSCPRKNEALCIDSKTGATYINSDKCEPDCTICIEACPFDTPRINFDVERNVPVKCDLCKDRAEGPACVEFCSVVCLELRDRRS
jgi:Fe-S-cluster-containing hydrogenase component 2